MFYYCQCLDTSMLYNYLSKEPPIFGCILIPTLFDCGLMTPHGDIELGQHEPDGKPSPETILTYNQHGFVVFIWGWFPRECSRYLYLRWVFKLLNQDNSHIVGTNELMIYLVQVWCPLPRPFATAVTICMGRYIYDHFLSQCCILTHIYMHIYVVGISCLTHMTQFSVSQIPMWKYYKHEKFVKN